MTITRDWACDGCARYDQVNPAVPQGWRISVTRVSAFPNFCHQRNSIVRTGIYSNQHAPRYLLLLLLTPTLLLPVLNGPFLPCPTLRSYISALPDTPETTLLAPSPILSSIGPTWAFRIIAAALGALSASRGYMFPAARRRRGEEWCI